jgi:hypothetical protein
MRTGLEIRRDDSIGYHRDQIRIQLSSEGGIFSPRHQSQIERIRNDKHRSTASPEVSNSESRDSPSVADTDDSVDISQSAR